MEMVFAWSVWMNFFADDILFLDATLAFVLLKSVENYEIPYMDMKSCSFIETVMLNVVHEFWWLRRYGGDFLWTYETEYRSPGFVLFFLCVHWRRFFEKTCTRLIDDESLHKENCNFWFGRLKHCSQRIIFRWTMKWRHAHLWEPHLHGVALPQCNLCVVFTRNLKMALHAHLVCPRLHDHADQFIQGTTTICVCLVFY